MSDYDKVVRRFVSDYVWNLSPDQMRELISEQHILISRIYVKILDKKVYLKKWQVGIANYGADIANDFNLPDVL